MMSTLQLQLLDATLRRHPVLSIYLALNAADTSDPHAWLLELRRALKSVRERVAAASHAEREQFEQCAGHAERALRALPTGSASQTWIAFVTPSGLHHSELAASAMPTTVSWADGIRLAPYLSLMREDQPVVVVICDASHADLWEQRGGTARLVERIHAHHASPHERSHAGAASLHGFHAGTRGAVGHDDVQRQRREGTRRMLEMVADRAIHLAGKDGCICVGGIAHTASQLTPMITSAHWRAELVRGLDVHATPHQVADAARSSSRAMRAGHDAARLQETIDRAAPAGFGLLGPADSLRALEVGRVKELFITERFVRERLDDAEWAVRQAQRQGAPVSILGGDSAARLDEQGGIAAWLRYRLDGTAAPQKTA